MGDGNLQTIRLAVVDDAAAIAAVQATSWLETYAGLLPERVLAARTDVNRLFEAVQRRLASVFWDHRVFVAEQRGTVCGFIWIASSEERERELLGAYDQHVYAFYVIKSEHGKGRGRSLMVAAASDMLNRGYRSLSLEVLATNPARRFYEHLGATFISSLIIRDGVDSWEQCAYAWNDVALMR